MRASAIAFCTALACQAASAATPEAGPVGEKTPPAKWGAVVHDTVNDEHVWFGGVLRLMGRVLPRPLLSRMIPFNIGEFYVVARRPA